MLLTSNAVLVVGFVLSLYSSKGSIGSILLAMAAILSFWILNSSGEVCPTESAFITKFMKGLASHKKQFNPVKKAYPISYTKLEQLFYSVCQGRKFWDLSFFLLAVLQDLRKFSFFL